MPVYTNAYLSIRENLQQQGVTLVAVSKTRTPEDILALYALGQRDFGENYVQEFIAKCGSLPADIRWHFIGHLQTNKVKQIAALVYLIHGVDSIRLLQEINKQGKKLNRTIACLLQVHIASEATKFGLDETELQAIAEQLSALPFIEVRGLMGMASNTDDTDQVKKEFQRLRQLAENFPCPQPPIISMGMSNDYTIAVEEGSTMVRIGSLIFGSRT